MLSALVLSFVLLLAPSAARAEEKPLCSAVLYDDAELLKALPPRLRPIVESAHFRTPITNRDAAWKAFHQALDDGLAKPGKRFTASFGEASVSFHFRARTEVSTALWRVTGVSRGLDLVIDDLRLGTSRDGFAFLDFVAAELAWIAKARATGKLERGLTIYGRDVRDLRLADLLASIGFKKSKWPGPQCYLYGVAGGIVGYAGGRVFFAQFDANDQNGSIYEEQRKFYRDVAFGAAGGTGVAVASACFNKTGRNYSIDFDPEGIPKKTDPIPDEPKVPQIDVPSGDVIPNEPSKTAPEVVDVALVPEKKIRSPESRHDRLPNSRQNPAPGMSTGTSGRARDPKSPAPGL